MYVVVLLVVVHGGGVEGVEVRGSGVALGVGERVVSVDALTMPHRPVES